MEQTFLQRTQPSRSCVTRGLLSSQEAALTSAAAGCPIHTGYCPATSHSRCRMVEAHSCQLQGHTGGGSACASDRSVQSCCTARHLAQGEAEHSRSCPQQHPSGNGQTSASHGCSHTAQEEARTDARHGMNVVNEAGIRATHTDSLHVSWSCDCQLCIWWFLICIGI